MSTISATITIDVDVEEAQEIADALLQLLQELSPVRTGFFRSSWSVTASDGEIEVFNAAEYASYLENGWSDQAPDGILGPAIQRLDRLIILVIGERVPFSAIIYS